MSVKLIKPPKVKCRAVSSWQDLMPKIFVYIEKKKVCSIYKDGKKHSSFYVGKDGKYSICLALITASYKALLRYETKKAKNKYERRQAAKVKTLDEVFGEN